MSDFVPNVVFFWTFFYNAIEEYEFFDVVIEWLATHEVLTFLMSHGWLNSSLYVYI